MGRTGKKWKNAHKRGKRDMKQHLIYKYEAFDGTMFDYENECRDYEIAEKSKKASVTLLDYKWNKLELNDDGASRAYAIIFNSSEDIAFIKELFDDVGVGHPFEHGYGNCEEKVGIYVYDEHHDRWVNFDAKFAEIKDIYERCLAYRR